MISDTRLDGKWGQVTAADILILVSEKEGLGRCVVEAMAMEKAVVVTDGDGTCEIVQHQKTGLVAKSGDIEDIADSINQLLLKPDLRRQLGQAARRWAIDNLSSDIAAKQVMNIYDRILGVKN